jgi:meso-butanediol dehydrogenase/(S,S)-butanediol dehydrogenase/diacetyl reductase
LHNQRNAICPGFVDTYMWDVLAEGMKLPGKSREETFQRIINSEVPQGRPQTSEDMAALAVFFATNDNVTGQAWNVSGGAVLY